MDSAGVPEWMNGVMNSARDSNVTLSITLDGMPGANNDPRHIANAFHTAVLRGRKFGIGPGQELPGPNNGTAWEMSVVERQVRMGNRSWSSIQWYSGGRRIEGVVNPFS
ncbi:polymorphic toxin type 27 domain-containing protein [Streptomyces sp. NPDC058676]|uniref:polymorphic toxin type 27 domain-containing protein n=1 Tax=unclassified Streptomyces TaxID=2593676 RepID=UPI00364910CB